MRLIVCHGSQPTRDEYTYLPNIMDEHIDTERKRRVKQIGKGNQYSLK